MSDVVAPALGASSAVTYSFVAAFAFMAWETLISLGYEAEFIWSARAMSPTKFPFLILRWYTLAFLFVIQASVTGLGFATRFSRPPHCQAWLAFQIASLQIAVALQQYLMALRVFALYNRNRTLIRILGAFLVLEQLGIAGENIIIVPLVRFGEHGCRPLKLPTPVVGFVTCAVLFDLLLLGLIFLKAASVWRAGGRVPLLTLIVRDGALAFLAVCSIFWLNDAVFRLLDPSLSSVAWPWMYAINAAAAGRVVLQMHAQGGAPVRELMHTTDTNLALTTFDAEVKHDAEQLRHRLSRWDDSSVYEDVRLER